MSSSVSFGVMGLKDSMRISSSKALLPPLRTWQSVNMPLYVANRRPTLVLAAFVVETRCNAATLVDFGSSPSRLQWRQCETVHVVRCSPSSSRTESFGPLDLTSALTKALTRTCCLITLSVPGALLGKQFNRSHSRMEEHSGG